MRLHRVSHQNVVSPNNTNDEDGLEEELRLASLLNEAFVEQQQAQLRAETVDAFLQKFDLDPQHAAILDTFDFSDIEQDGFVFLEALDRVYKIKRELSTQSVFSDQANHRLGASSAIRMMESLANKQERAYEKLYHWLQQYLYLNQSLQDDNNNISISWIPMPWTRHFLIHLSDNRCGHFIIRLRPFIRIHWK